MRTIAQIDKDINSNERGALAGLRTKPSTAMEWHEFRLSHLEFDRRDHELYLERGLAQQERAEREALALAAKPINIPRRKKCPTCGR